MWSFPLLVLALVLALSLPVGRLMAAVMDGHIRLRRIEGLFDTGGQSGRDYAFSLLLFNSLLYAAGFVVLALQPALPLNPEGKGMLAPTTVFHTVISFFANNSQQHY